MSKFKNTEMSGAFVHDRLLDWIERKIPKDTNNIRLHWFESTIRVRESEKTDISEATFNGGISEESYNEILSKMNFEADFWNRSEYLMSVKLHLQNRMEILKNDHLRLPETKGESSIQNEINELKILNRIFTNVVSADEWIKEFETAISSIPRNSTSETLYKYERAID